MRKEYKALFDTLSPVRGDDELLKAVLDRKAEKNMATKKFSKNIFIPVIAAAVLGTTAVGASAAYRWSQARAVQDVIDKTATNKVNYPKFDLNKLGGKTLNDVIECDGYTIKTIGIAADQHTAYMFYDIVFDEDFDYSLKENEEWGCVFYPRSNLSWVMEYWGTMGQRNTDAPDPTWTGKNGFLGMEGNVAHLYSTFTMSGLTLSGKTLDYENHFGLQRVDKTDPKNSELVFEDKSSDGAAFSVDIDFVTEGNSVTVKPDSKVSLSNSESQTGTLKHVELTPFSVFARVHWDFEGEKYDMNNPITYKNNGKFEQSMFETDAVLASLRVTFKDGTVKDISAFVMDNSHTSDHADKNGIRETDIAVCWESPVDIDQIASVTICDVEVKF